MIIVRWNEKRGFFDVDIKVRTPDGSICRERRRSPVQDKDGALKWATRRATHLAFHGKTKRTPESYPYSRKLAEKSAHDAKLLEDWLTEKADAWVGWVYFIRGSNQAIKIGWARDVTGRLTDLQTGCPLRYELLGARPGTVQHERMLHRRFKGLHLRGEWFSSGAELLAFIRDHAERFERGAGVEQQSNQARK